MKQMILPFLFQNSYGMNNSTKISEKSYQKLQPLRNFLFLSLFISSDLNRPFLFFPMFYIFLFCTYDLFNIMCFPCFFIFFQSYVSKEPLKLWGFIWFLANWSEISIKLMHSTSINPIHINTRVVELQIRNCYTMYYSIPMTC